MKSKLFNLFFPIMLVLYEVVTYLSNDMYLPALPQMMTDLHLDLTEGQLTLTLWFLGAAVMPLLMGPLSDRFGRRPVLFIGGILYLSACIMTALAHSLSCLLLGRFIAGSMVPSMLVPGYATIHELYDQKQAIRILALMGSISVLAPAFGPFLGSLVLYVGSWRTIFFCIALGTVMVLVVLYRAMPETLTRRTPLRLRPLFKSYARVLTNLRFLVLMFVLGFMFAGFLCWITAGPLLVMTTFGCSAMQFGLIQGGIFCVYIFANRLIKRMLEFLTPAQLIAIGISLTFCFSLAMVLGAQLFPEALWWFILTMSGISFGSALAFSPLNRLIIEASAESMGIRMAIFSVCLSGSAALGSAASSLFYNGSMSALAILIALCMMLSFCLLVFYRNYFSSTNSSLLV